MSTTNPHANNLHSLRAVWTALRNSEGETSRTLAAKAAYWKAWEANKRRLAAG